MDLLVPSVNTPVKPLGGSDEDSASPGSPSQAGPTQTGEINVASQQDLAMTNENDQLKRRQVIANCCKKSMKVIFSHVGLSGMVIVYSIIGGFIFQHLERTNEKQECVNSQNKYEPMENVTKYNLWEISANYRNDEDMEMALEEFQKQLVKFRDDVLALGYDGTNCALMGEPGGPAYKWSYPGALLFSVTVITTIGKINNQVDGFWIVMHHLKVQCVKHLNET